MADDIFLNLEPFDMKTIAPQNTRRRTEGYRTIPQTGNPIFFRTLVQRKKLFDSRVDAASTFGDDGVVSVANNASLTVNTTVTDTDGRLWLMIPEVSFFVGAVQSSNEWPNGSFFVSGTAGTNANNYDYFVVMKQLTSTNDVIKFSSRFTNRTGAAQLLGVTIGMRFMVNTTKARTF